MNEWLWSLPAENNKRIRVCVWSWTQHVWMSWSDRRARHFKCWLVVHLFVFLFIINIKKNYLTKFHRSFSFYLKKFFSFKRKTNILLTNETLFNNFNLTKKNLHKKVQTNKQFTSLFIKNTNTNSSHAHSWVTPSGKEGEESEVSGRQSSAARLGCFLNPEWSRSPRRSPRSPPWNTHTHYTGFS